VLALSLSAALPHRALLVTITLGVVFVSLVGQGVTTPLVLRLLDAPDRPTGVDAV